jgi:uncharacterized protein
MAEGRDPTVTFECQCCGECCSTMGEIISIREQIGPGEYRIGFTDGEERVVSIDPDKKSLFGDLEQGEIRSLACPFLRRTGPEKRICTVHDSRPELCRGYLCSRILIIGTDNKKAGRVPHRTRNFTTEDRVLLDLWSRTIRTITVPDEEEWEKVVENVFTQAGYRVIR